MTKTVPASPWWRRHVHADRRPGLIARGRIKAAIRRSLEEQGFTEVETGCLQVSPGNETHLHAFETHLIGNDLARRPLYLHTSPEFAMKKLLAAGETRIFTFAPVFRNSERGVLHAPEFTMLEWYRVGEPYTRLMDDCRDFMRIAAAVTENPLWSWRGRVIDTRLEPERLSVADAFQRHVGIDLGGDDGGLIGRDALAEGVRRLGRRVEADDTWSSLFSRLITEFEPQLGTRTATLLDRYPTSEAALARPTSDDPRFAERFELYCAGIELANGFGELTDPAAQRANLEAQMAEKQRLYGERYPIDEDFIAALADMPPASGCALGFDRLVLLATAATHIDRILWTPMTEG